MDRSTFTVDGGDEPGQRLLPGERLLLELVQQDIPLEERPFLKWAQVCGLTEKEILDRLSYFLETGLVREISALLDKSQLGYKSTLVAARVMEPFLEKAVERVNSHPGVSHNYLREYAYNLWFTLSIREEESFQAVIESLLPEESGPSFLILEALKTFKLKVHLPFGTEKGEMNREDTDNGRDQGSFLPDRERGNKFATESVRPNRISEANSPVPVSDVGITDKEQVVLRELERSFPLTCRPFQELGIRTGLAEEDLLTVIKGLKGKGIIRRIAGVVRHLKAGFVFNGLVCFALHPDAVVQAGEQLAASPLVSHCYWRKSYPSWPYSLYAMIHAREKSICEQWALHQSERLACPDYQLLFSSREYKKERVKLFG